MASCAGRHDIESSAALRSIKAMPSLLFMFGFLVGVSAIVIGVTNLVIAVRTFLAWLDGVVVMLRARINDSP
jgi:hypothetical protein